MPLLPSPANDYFLIVSYGIQDSEAPENALANRWDAIKSELFSYPVMPSTSPYCSPLDAVLFRLKTKQLPIIKQYFYLGDL